MKIDPRIADLERMVVATMAHFQDGAGLEIVTLREQKCAVLMIHISTPNGINTAGATLQSIEQIDELIREAQAARADLLKLMAPNTIQLPYPKE